MGTLKIIKKMVVLASRQLLFTTLKDGMLLHFTYIIP